MAIVYFGAWYPLGSLNGNWSDVNQWYSDPGDTGEIPRVGTRLNRLPNPATDIVAAYFQDITSGVGTYTGPVTDARFKDPNAVFTGTISNSQYYYGTFSGTLNGSIRIYGGTFTSSIIIDAQNYYIQFNEADSGNGTPIPLTLPSNFNLSYKVPSVYIGRSMTWNYPINFLANNYSYITIQKGSISNQLPIITIDISTPSTNCKTFQLFFTNNSGTLTDANTVLTNTAPLIFGTITQPARFELYYVAPNREITAYIGKSDYTYNTSSRINCGTLSPTYDKLNLFQCPNFDFQQVQVDSPVTWVANYNLPLTRTTEGSKYKLLQSDFPQQYTFGITGNSIFNPTLNLKLTKNLSGEV